MEKRSLYKIFAISIFLTVITFVLYWPVQYYGFVEFDDDLYVVKNDAIAKGLSRESLVWAFSNMDAGFWHPLTWLSHLLDVEIFQFNAGSHHWTSVLIHVISTLFLFTVLSVMTGRCWPSALTAALFAMHPLHVESVAWIAERKDVLSGFFWILTVGLHVFYVNRPSLIRYTSLLAVFMLGLLSKPMVVTLPIILLLLDYWPLKRFQGTATIFDNILPAKVVSDSFLVIRLFVEKIPLLMLSAASSALAVVAQRNIGALSSFNDFPLESRLANAPVACVAYLGKMFYPFDLAVFYPHPGLQPFWKVAGAIFVLGGVTTLALRWVRSYPYWAVGWFWYLISLLPVMGIVQVGSHAMADRYTYIPLIGAFIMIAWSLDTAVQRWNRSKTGLLLLGCGMIIGCFAVSSTQIGYWRDYKTLFEHANQVTEQNHIVCNNLAVISYREGEVDEAIRYLKRAIEIKYDYRDAWLNLGVAYLSKKRHEAAVISLRNAVAIDPATVKNRIILAVALKYAGQPDASADEFMQVLARDPDNGEAHSYLGMIRSEQGRLGDAETHLREALRVQPHSAEAHHNLGLVLAGRRRTTDALAHFRQASALAPGNPYIEKNLKRAQNRNPK